jgi:hypothetical protein
MRRETTLDMVSPLQCRAFYNAMYRDRVRRERTEMKGDPDYAVGE